MTESYLKKTSSGKYGFVIRYLSSLDALNCKYIDTSYHTRYVQE